MIRQSRIMVLIAALMFVVAPVAASEGDGSAERDVQTVQKELDDEHAALSTTDCHVACRALASIHRAAERICELDPGPRCQAARAKEADARRRVREACPDCEVASPPEQPHDERAASLPQNAPPSERSGGCRSCAITDDQTSPDVAFLALAILGGVRVFKKRRVLDRSSISS